MPSLLPASRSVIPMTSWGLKISAAFPAMTQLMAGPMAADSVSGSKLAKPRPRVPASSKLPRPEIE